MRLHFYSILLHLGGRDLAVPAGQGQNLVPRGFHGSGLMDMDMTAVGTEHALVGPQSRGDHRQVRLGAAHQEVDIDVLPGALGLDVAGGDDAGLLLGLVVLRFCDPGEMLVTVCQ